jgi:hypothetical protein
MDEANSPTIYLFIYLIDENNILKMIRDSHANSNPPTNKR